MPRPGIVGLRRSMVIRLRPFMVMSAPPPSPPARFPGTVPTRELVTSSNKFVWPRVVVVVGGGGGGVIIGVPSS